jgi:uncharacterized protein (TIGR02145 family)
MKKTVLLFLLISGFTSQAQITDIDGNSYDTVRIGTQMWMAENLNVSRFRNGDEIPMVVTDEDWALASKNKQPAWCYVFNDSSSSVLLGKLYNWYAVNDSRGLAPEGWHVASDTDWTQLTDHLGGNYYERTDASTEAQKLKDTSSVNINSIRGLNYRYVKDSVYANDYWLPDFSWLPADSNLDNNITGLTLRAGITRPDNGSFPVPNQLDDWILDVDAYVGAYFWTSTIGQNKNKKVVLRWSDQVGGIHKKTKTYSMKKMPLTRYVANEDLVYRMTAKEGQGLFVRCIKD